MRRDRFAKVVSLLLVVSVGWLASGCFGKFQLTRMLHEANQSVEDKYLRSAVTWLFVIPYALTGVLDIFIFNLIEFWSGENPIAGGPSTKVVAWGDETVTMTLAREGGTTLATIERRKGGALLSTLAIRDDGKGSVTSEMVAPGKETVRSTAAMLPNGSVEVVTLSRLGVKTERHPASAVETILVRAARIAGEVRHALSGAPGPGSLASPARVPKRDIPISSSTLRSVPPQS
jgi:hypothetical protein